MHLQIMPSKSSDTQRDGSSSNTENPLPEMSPQTKTRGRGQPAKVTMAL